MFINPGYFVSAIVSSALVKMSAETIYNSSVLQHVEYVAQHFTVVSSNLMNQYQEASEIVATSFSQKNAHAVHKAINALIEGQNKTNEGTLQRIFDKRDIDATKLKMEEMVLKDEQATSQTSDDWINIRK